MHYEPTLASLSQHRVPDWYEDAKFGIFIHWTPSSIPAYAPWGLDIQALIRSQGQQAMFSNSPYSEWYLNSLRIPGSPVQRHHLATFGPDHDYARFVEQFRQTSAGFDPEAWLELIRGIHARYLVFVTKHHDGFLLWPSRTRHPKRANWHAERDLVGDLARATRAAGLRLGFYYSGALDWSFTSEPVTGIIQMLASGPASRRYADYVHAHYLELIERHAPDVLWNDIAYPAKGRLRELIARYYNDVPEGLINDRWMETGAAFRLMARVPWLKRAMNRKAAELFGKGTLPPPGVHTDYSTPEYRTLSAISERKWECVRGIGHSFGYNAQEPDESYLDGAALAWLLTDIVAKNGNLLLNIGPRADGTIPEVQRRSLLGLGDWLGRNGEAIFGTRPWRQAELANPEGVAIRVTAKADQLYVLLSDRPAEGRITLPELQPGAPVLPSLLDGNRPLQASASAAGLRIELPAVQPHGYPIAIRLPRDAATAH